MVHYEFCPKCGGTRKTSLSVALKNAPDINGEKQTILTFNLHCEACLTFIRSIQKGGEEVVSPSRLPVYLP